VLFVGDAAEVAVQDFSFLGRYQHENICRKAAGVGEDTVYPQNCLQVAVLDTTTNRVARRLGAQHPVTGTRYAAAELTPPAQRWRRGAGKGRLDFLCASPDTIDTAQGCGVDTLAPPAAT
jgi:hypothetical protein